MSYDPHQPPPTRQFSGPPQQAPYQPGPAYPYSAPPGYGMPPPKKKRGAGFWILMSVLIVLAVCLFGGTLVNLAGGGSGSTGKTVATGPATAGDAAADPATRPAGSATPKVSDFTLTPKITRKHCFGSVGCNIDFTVEMAYSGKALDDSDTWVITYEVSGDEGGPLVDQLELTGTQFDGEEQSISTPSSSTKIKIKVTGVEKQ